MKLNPFYHKLQTLFREHVNSFIISCRHDMVWYVFLQIVFGPLSTYIFAGKIDYV